MKTLKIIVFENANFGQFWRENSNSLDINEITKINTIFGTKIQIFENSFFYHFWAEKFKRDIFGNFQTL